MLGPEHPEVATSLNNLALLLKAQRKYTEAEQVFKRALLIMEKSLGQNHPDVGTSLNHLANLYQEQRKFAEAELSLYERALALLEASLGPEHQDLTPVINSLVEVIKAQGKPEQAEPFYQQLLAIKEINLGPTHPRSLHHARQSGNLSLFARQIRRGRKNLQENARQQRNVSIGRQNPQIVSALSNLAMVYQAQHKFAQCESLYKEVVAICEKAYPPDHPEVVAAIYNLANMYQLNGRYAKAEPFWRRLKNIAGKIKWSRIILMLECV